MIDLSAVKDVYFLGIGGIGISALARMMLAEGKEVSGSDLAESLVTKELEKAGARIFIGQDEKDIPAETDLVVYTVALPELAPEFFESLKKRGIPLLSYPELLGLFSKEKYTIAIAGTHGKTTTTAMVAKLLLDAGLDPTVVVGSLLLDRKSNFISGRSKYLVVEADEYRRAFLNLNPSVLVITNIDADHLDYYKDLADVRNAFMELAKKLKPDDFLLVNEHAPNIDSVVRIAKCKIGDWSRMPALSLKVPGEHNRQNAKAAFSVGKVLGIPEEKIKQALEAFAGTWRRFEYKGKTASGTLVYDDYAHNPQKVAAAISGAREAYPDKKIIAVFQPHLFSRTKTLLREFAGSFNDADEVILLPIYAAREKPDPSITSEMLGERIKANNLRVKNMSSFDEVETYFADNGDGHCVALLIGAGDINKLSERLIEAKPGSV